MRQTASSHNLITLLSLLTLWLPQTVSAKSAPFELIEEKYGIKVIARELPFPVKETGCVFDGTQATETQIKAADRMLKQELRYYSKDILQRIKLQKIIIGANLTLNGRHLGGLADYRNNVFYLDAAYVLVSDDHIRKTFHHELFHMLDFQDDQNTKCDEAWEQLNPLTFKYGDGGFTMLNDPRVGLITDKYPGFINRYSTSSVAEDKAEIYCHMVANSALMEEIAKHDAIVMAKLNAMKKLLAQFHPEMVESFWRAIERNRPVTTKAGIRTVTRHIIQGQNALKTGNLLNAYRAYKRAEKAVGHNLGGKEQLKFYSIIFGNLAGIYQYIGQPLAAAEEALKRNDTAAALKALEFFEKHYINFNIILEFRNRYQQIADNKTIVMEKHERISKQKLVAADAAYNREDYLSAHKRYSTAARLYTETKSAKTAQTKLDKMLADPVIAAALEQQTAKFECTALLGRAGILLGEGRRTKARAIYDQIIVKYPNTEWAEKASQRKTELDNK